MQTEIYNIVLTGGPCAGKSSALTKIEHMFTSLGYNVFLVPETATEIIGGGITINRVGVYNFQKILTKHLINKENSFIEAAKKTAGKSIIIYDRGALDFKAYVNSEQFYKILNKINYTEAELLNRYDAILHLKTAADGAEQFYTTNNNLARKETAEQARELDKKTMQAWVGHPKLRIIKNSFTFEEKMQEVLAQMCSIIGIPKPLEIERKFLIEKPNIEELSNKISMVNKQITQVYLYSTNKDVERRIRKISGSGGDAYFYTEKQKFTDKTRYETETKITKDEYEKLIKFKDPKTDIINKTRNYFVYKNQYFELDLYPQLKNHAILELEMIKENQKITMPSYIKVVKEVTTDKDFKNKNLATLIKNNTANLNELVLKKT